MKKKSSDFMVFVALAAFFLSLVIITLYVRTGSRTKALPSVASSGREVACPLGTAPVKDCSKLLKNNDSCFWRCEPEKLIPSPGVAINGSCAIVICPLNCKTVKDTSNCDTCECSF